MNIWIIFFAVIVAIFIYHRFFSSHALISNFSIPAWGRYIFEMFGPPFRQYWFSNDREEKPFNRKERSYVYQSAKGVNRNQSFGSDADWESINHFNILQANFAHIPKSSILPTHYVPAAKVIGLNRKRPYHPDSIVNISAISFGSQSDRATKIMNMGAALSGAYHNTGEGGYTKYHKIGAQVVWQIGTGNFGARNHDGTLNIDKIVEVVNSSPELRMIEIKISQGAKPGKGGILPAKKVSKEIAEIRGIPFGEDCISPAVNPSITNNQELIDVIEEIAERTGLPVGIKAAIGQMKDWEELFQLMARTGKGPDFFQVDGAEGGTGSAPASYADHMAMPLEQAFAKVYKAYIFSGAYRKKDMFWMASGGLATPAKAIKMFAMGADAICIARPAMFAMGCLQTQHCHKNNCPVGIQTNRFWLKMGLKSGYAAKKVARYIETLRKDILDMTHSAGYEHPSQFKMQDVEKNSWQSDARKSLFEIYEYHKISNETFVSMEDLRARHQKISELKTPNFIAFSVKESRMNYFWEYIKNLT